MFKRSRGRRLDTGHRVVSDATWCTPARACALCAACSTRRARALSETLSLLSVRAHTPGGAVRRRYACARALANRLGSRCCRIRSTAEPVIGRRFSLSGVTCCSCQVAVMWPTHRLGSIALGALKKSLDIWTQKRNKNTRRDAATAKKAKARQVGIYIGMSDAVASSRRFWEARRVVLWAFLIFIARARRVV